jgi:hypothetical protein
MAKPKIAVNETEKVDAYMSALVHPLKKEIAELRNIIKSADPRISERIKWAAPSFFYIDDMVTFNHRQEKFVQLVFHHPSIVEIPSELLEGNYADRRLAAFHSMDDIKTKKKELQRILKLLVAGISRQASH